MHRSARVLRGATCRKERERVRACLRERGSERGVMFAQRERELVGACMRSREGERDVSE